MVSVIYTIKFLSMVQCKQVSYVRNFEIKIISMHSLGFALLGFVSIECKPIYCCHGDRLKISPLIFKNDKPI